MHEDNPHVTSRVQTERVQTERVIFRDIPSRESNDVFILQKRRFFYRKIIENYIYIQGANNLPLQRHTNTIIQNITNIISIEKLNDFLHRTRQQLKEAVHLIYERIRS